MDKRLSLYLDTARLIAALVVVLDHARPLILPWAPVKTILFGGDAVVVFFVLSGFVIRFVTIDKETDWRTYARARALRMYSVAPLAIVATVLADTVGRAVNPGWYAAHDVALLRPDSFYVPDWSWRSVVRYMSFTNEAWLHHTTIGTSGPYWSLGFEVPYYILFGTLVFTARRSTRACCAIVWFAVFGIKVAIFLPLWLLGVITYRLIANGVRMPKRAAGIVLAAALPLAIAWKAAVDPGGATMFIWQSLANTMHLAVYALGLAVIFASSLLAFHSLARPGDVGVPSWAGPVRWLAGASFTLYLTHLPLLALAAALREGAVGGWMMDLATLAIVIACSVALAELGERRKALLARAVDALGKAVRRTVPPTTNTAVR